jgi:sialate O-acetylesterase
MKKLLLLALAITASGRLSADVKLPAIISDGMVLERSAKVPIWGWADPGEDVKIAMNTASAGTKADADGKWMAVLDLKDFPPGPFQMSVEGKNKITISDVVVGEVWIASGQSNMEWKLKNTRDAAAEIASSANPLLRQFLVEKKASLTPIDELRGQWTAASPETSGDFSAVGYFFGKKLQEEIRVPVGIINSSWGGTPSEAWTSREALDSDPGLKAASERIRAQIAEYPGLAKAFAEGMDTWTRETGRADKPTADPSAFAGEEVSTDGWVPVKIPGEVKAPGLPNAGVVWLRKEVNIPSPTALPLSLPIDGFDSVYWNGKLIRETPYREFPGSGHTRRLGPYDLPADAVKAGKNILAIRLHEPVGPAKFTGVPKAGTIALDGEWLARAEIEFPPVAADKLAAAPRPPSAVPPHPQHAPASLFNAMIHPLIPYAISGVIWYQGEANAWRAVNYRKAFPLLISDWRKQWGRGDFPFYFCQLANYMAKKPDPEESGWAELREAQSMTLALPATGQAVLIDIGESGDIHPRNKKSVGERLALIALAKDYGKTVPFSGPVFDSMKIGNGTATITFRHADGGLTAARLPEKYDVKSQSGESAPLVRNSPNSQIEGFAICGEDKKWVWADASIEGNSVVVRSDKVPSPVAVRYAWASNPTCNLVNGAGLPASPFRTDDFPAITVDGKY